MHDSNSALEQKENTRIKLVTKMIDLIITTHQVPFWIQKFKIFFK